MKARLSPLGITTGEQRKAIRELVTVEFNKQSEAHKRRLLKIVCASLNEEFGFGHDRCMRLLASVSSLSYEHEHDELFWRHIDMLMKQIGLEFSNEIYEEMGEL